MNYQKQYADKINWKNSPDTSTPLNATNLNKMDNALWYMDTALYTISKVIGGGSSARGGIISNVGNNAFTTHVHQRTGESLAENELLILRSDVSGTGNSINVYTDSSSAVGFGLLDLDGESTSITVTTDSVVVLMITDADTDYTAQVLAVIDTAGGSGISYAGLGIGKKTGVSSNVIDTDIDLHRSPMAGDRLLVYFDEKITDPTGLKTYNNGVAVTSNLENVIPLYINAGWNILEFKNDGLLYNNVWVRKQNVPVPSTLAGMSDTLIVSPSDNQLLVYDNGKWKNKKFVEANVGVSDTELKKIKVGDIVYDTDGLRDYSVSSIANNNITISVLNSNQFVMENIAINTGNHSGSSNGWNLVLTDGMNPVSVALKNADGSPFADDIHENELLFVYVDTAGNIARVLEIHSHDLEILKDAIITEKTVSGNPLTVTDALPYNAVSLSAEIEASQDLHGLPFPYAGGAYKNKLPMTVSGIKALNTNGTWNGNVYNYRGVDWTILTDNADNVIGIKANGTANQTSQLLFGSFNLVNGAQYAVTDGTTTSGSDYNVRIGNASDAYVTNTNGGTATFTADTANTALVGVVNGKTANNVIFLPMIRLSTESDASYAPYSNICPISGRTEARVDTVGRNVWDEQWELGYYSVDDGTTRSSDSNIRSKNTSPIVVSPNTQYYLRVPYSSSVASAVLFYDENNNYISWSQVQSSNPIFTTPANAKYIKFYLNANYGVTYHNDICINVSDPSFNGQYKPYVQPTNVTIQLGQTVYGGTLNVTTGVLTVDHQYQSVTLDSIYVRSGNANCDYAIFVIDNAWGDFTAIDNSFISDMMRWISSNENFDNISESGVVLVYSTGAKQLAVSVPKGYTIEQASALFTGAHVCLSLATPTTIQLTPTQLQMLKGYNRLSSDGGGDITLTYKADRLAAIEAALQNT